MKFTCSTKDIASAVGAASKLVNSHTTVPILSSVLLTTNGCSIRVQSTDLEVSIENSFPAEVAEPGQAAIPAKFFSGYLGNVSPGIVEVASNGSGDVRVKWERSNCEFHSLPAGEYPLPPQAQEGVSFSIGAKAFRDGVKATTFAACSEEARGAVMMGTLLEVSRSRLTMVATDGHRLAKWETDLQDGAGHDGSYVVPSRALDEAARNVVGDESVDVTILGEAENQLAFTGNGSVVIVRLVDGKYPDYLNVVPKKFDTSVTVNAEALISSLKRAMVISTDSANKVSLAIENDRLVISASGDTTGSMSEEIDVDQRGPDLGIVFNAKLLIEGLSHISAPQVVLEFVGSLAAASVRPVPDEDGVSQQYVLMPLRP